MGKLLCCDCGYLGDKYSFPMPNDLLGADENNPALKRYYCCNGDCSLYKKDVSVMGIEHCRYFEEI